VPGEVDAERLKAHVRALSETFSPRDHTRPDNLERAAAYIQDALARAGGRVESQPYRVEGRAYRNVIARFGPEEGERIIVGAHYDAESTTPGADDNASGVAGLLELAALLGRHPPAMRVDLVGFTLEEMPHFRTQWQGSAVYAQALRAAGVRVRAMFSLEMLGTFTEAPGSQRYPAPGLGLRYGTKGNYIAVVGRVGEGELVRTITEAMRAATPLPVQSLNAPRSLEGIDFSDHASFWDLDYPAVMVTDTAFFRNPRYHTAEDTWDTLDYARMAQVVQGVHCAVHALAPPKP
jgi:Zn-dependent M28 family amino/carboxypeptidase